MTTPKRIQAKGFFLTYPQCTLTKEELLELLQTLPIKTPIEEYVIAEERHKDGSPHLHAFIKYASKITFSPKLWDISTFHGNYQVSKSWKAVRKYCEKEGNYISNFAVEEAKNKHSKKITYEHLSRDPIDLVEEGILPPMSLPNFVKAQQLFSLLKKKRERIDITDLPNDKQRHAWVYGPSNTGKTTKLKTMIETLGESECFQIPYNNDWVGYNQERVLYCDEFKGQLTAQDLNRLCDGNAKVNTKGGSAQLHPCPQICILSNYSIKECFKNVPENIIESLQNRFVEQLQEKLPSPLE